MKTFVFGHSRLELPILGHQFWSSDSAQHLLLLGGVHGDEVEGTALAHALLSKLIQTPIANLNLTLVPQFNPEGLLLKTRQNHKGIDLNRNLPTKDWSCDFTKIRYYPGDRPASEPENQALVEFLTENTIDFLISLHSWKPMLNTNGNCDPIAPFLSKQTRDVIAPDIGYPTPGSLGTYAGLERNIPTLTYELQKGLDLEEILKTHLKPLYDSLVLYSKRN